MKLHISKLFQENLQIQEEVLEEVVEEVLEEVVEEVLVVEELLVENHQELK